MKGDGGERKNVGGVDKREEGRIRGSIERDDQIVLWTDGPAQPGPNPALCSPAPVNATIMAFSLLGHTSPGLQGFRHTLRPYATVHSPLVLARPPNPPLHTSGLRPLDRFVLEALARTPSAARTALPQLIQQYLDRAGNVLGAQLPYEPNPSPSRRVSFSTDKGGCVHLIAHAAREGDRHKVTVSSGFALDTPDGQSIFVTCAHTLEEVRHPSGMLCMTPSCLSQ
jgi:hypothetical protein